MREETMKKTISILGLLFIGWAASFASAKDLEIQGTRLISEKPPFTMSLPSELQLMHSSSGQNPNESSATRVYFLIKEKKKQVEEMFILQIADRTNPQAGPISAPPLLPYTGKRMYLKDKVKKGELTVDYMIQLMAWNPEASSLQPIAKKGIVIPSQWALQGQLLFNFQGEHAVLVRYSKAVDSFGLKVSEDGKNWEKESMAGNEKQAYEMFRKSFMETIDSIRITSK